MRVAVVDRDAGFLHELAGQVEPLGWTLIVHTAPVTSVTLRGGRPHAVLVDIDLLGPRWDAWLARHPASVPSLGILVCTRQSTVAQRVRGLRVGVDDWVTKPIEPAEVVARLYAIVRRCRQELPVEMLRLHYGELTVRIDLFDAFVGGRSAGLTHREFNALLCLARGNGGVLERRKIHHEVWGYAMAQGDRSLDTTVRRIRRKLAAISPGWSYVRTHRGVGYSFSLQRRP
jgi:DNA-binding response OmpR family regulator